MIGVQRRRTGWSGVESRIPDLLWGRYLRGDLREPELASQAMEQSVQMSSGGKSIFRKLKEANEAEELEFGAPHSC